MIRIVGAGFSGLSLAYFFTKLGYSVTVVEKKERTGGLISSEFRNGVLVESAANGFLASEKIEALLADIGVTPLITKSESRKKYIYRNGLKRWPLSFSESVSLGFRLIRAFLTGKTKPTPGESLSAWAQRVLGAAGDDYLIQPMVNGIFAQKTDRLSARLVLGSMFFPKKKKRLRGLLSAKNGMGEVIQCLESYLRRKGVVFELNQDEEINLINSQHNTFLAINLFSLKSSFAFPISEKLSLKTDDLLALSLVRVTLTYRNKPQEIDGFGVLFPNKERFFSLGVLANSKIFENRGEYSESWILGDTVLPELMSLSDEQILEKIVSDRKRILVDDIQIKQASVHRWPKSIPSYDSALEQFLDAHSELSSKLTGNYLGVLGLTGIHERNFQIAKAFAEKK